MAKITVYSKAYCPFCMRAKALLKQKGASFKEIDIGRKPQLRDEMIAKSNGGYTVPQIFIDQLHVGGCDDLMRLDAQGKLDDLLD